ncbi:hypothetical protein TRICI_000296 [Trichomonascus ciferrii]|uniref:SET domain-containing protein n=1 Tax=Trichomonascus ciferrii TaxID=44093 RepID=A0A642VDU0_9ASCO|nr:hypothetical protein TRICI_000296 [Trichomonascus ciferrii]
MSFDAENEQFVDWLKANGVTLSPKIALHDYRAEGQGRGVIATEDIGKDEVLFTIPRSSLLAVDNDETFSQLVSGENDFGTWLNLMAYMMVVSESSRWKPYYNMLPKSFNTPMFWSDEQINMLQGSALKDKIGKEEAEEQYNENIKPFLEANREKFGGQSGFENTLDAFHRMGSIIMAYSFDVKEKNAEDDAENSDDEEEEPYVKAMVPMADMLNAHTRLCNAHLCHTEDNTVLEMRSIKKIPKGAQVYNTYGELPNSDLLRRYGYVESGGTEFDVVEIPTNLIAKAVQDLGYGQAEQLLEELEQDEDNVFYDDGYDIPVSGEPDLPTLVILLYLQIAASHSPDILPSKKKLFRAIAKACEDDKLTHEAKAVWKATLETRLKNYPPQLVEQAKSDLDPEPKDDVIVDPQQMCNEVLLGELRILFRSMKWADEAPELITTDSLLKSITNKRQPENTNASNKKQKK